ncbi:hypothetical protein WICMUC_002859 [Wickerhamomyces mucosus]|uniref:Protein SUR7 n=1 Tax=Wickerhamomyces mucosus TaxID=1378264 RepID=A0A9P8PP26_9ASCO|nr:hypothetical protein WICMUC_002859 [Wickerhamomyces mucosus]
MRISILTYLVQLLLTLGATLLLIFIVLSGAVDHFPFTTFYWIQADTSSISGAPSISRWTFWGLAENEDNRSKSITLSPAYPFSPVDNFNETTNIPTDFIDNRDVYFYLSRFAFAFYWVALAFTVVSLVVSAFSIFSLSVIKVNGWLVSIALLFAAGATSFQTAIIVKGKQAFSNSNIYAKIGPALLGVAWASVAVLIILFFLSWAELIFASYRKHKDNVRYQKEQEAYEQRPDYLAPTAVQTQPAPNAQETPAHYDETYAQNQGTLPNESTGIKFFKIKRHNKDDGESV